MSDDKLTTLYDIIDQKYKEMGYASIRTEDLAKLRAQANSAEPTRELRKWCLDVSSRFPGSVDVVGRAKQYEAYVIGEEAAADGEDPGIAG